MKKSGILLALILCAGLFTTVAAKKNSSGKAIKNGFGISLVTGIPSTSYGLDEGKITLGDAQYDFLIGLQLGNRWYIAPQEKFGFGIMVNWLDITAATTSHSYFGTDYTNANFDLTLIEFGPIGTFAINEDMAIDAYYNLRPTLLVSVRDESTPATRYTSETNHTDVYTGFGPSHAIGTAFRWKVLNVGVEYVLGSINCSSVGTTTTTNSNGYETTFTMPDQNISTNSIRILLGVKF